MLLQVIQEQSSRPEQTHTVRPRGWNRCLCVCVCACACAPPECVCEQLHRKQVQVCFLLLIIWQVRGRASEDRATVGHTPRWCKYDITADVTEVQQSRLRLHTHTHTHTSVFSQSVTRWSLLINHWSELYLSLPNLRGLGGLSVIPTADWTVLYISHLTGYWTNKQTSSDGSKPVKHHALYWTDWPSCVGLVDGGWRFCSSSGLWGERWQFSVSTTCQDLFTVFLIHLRCSTQQADGQTYSDWPWCLFQLLSVLWSQKYLLRFTFVSLFIDWL